jgi:hypothetical protein
VETPFVDSFETVAVRDARCNFTTKAVQYAVRGQNLRQSWPKGSPGDGMLPCPFAMQSDSHLNVEIPLGVLRLQNSLHAATSIGVAGVSGLSTSV